VNVELLIHSYFNIVKREMIDMVPKAISLTLVSHSKENLQRELLQELYKPEVLDDLLKESEFVVSRRKEVVSMVQALNKAEEYVLFLLLLALWLTSFFLGSLPASNDWPLAFGGLSSADNGSGTSYSPILLNFLRILSNTIIPSIHACDIGFSFYFCFK
jgi:hypothetical protein